jgi:hypothetical protein
VKTKQDPVITFMPEGEDKNIFFGDSEERRKKKEEELKQAAADALKTAKEQIRDEKSPEEVDRILAGVDKIMAEEEPVEFAFRVGDEVPVSGGVRGGFEKGWQIHSIDEKRGEATLVKKESKPASKVAQNAADYRSSVSLGDLKNWIIEFQPKRAEEFQKRAEKKDKKD